MSENNIEKRRINHPKTHKFTSKGLAARRISHGGENAPAKRPEVRSKISNTVKDLWDAGVYDNVERPKLVGEANPFYGKKHKEETNRINSEKHKGVVVAKTLDGEYIRVTSEELATNPLLGGNKSKIIRVRDHEGNEFKVFNQQFLERKDLIDLDSRRALYNDGEIERYFAPKDVPKGWLRGHIPSKHKYNKPSWVP